MRPRYLAALAFAVALAAPFLFARGSAADEAVLYEFGGSFEDAAFLAKEAIVGQGLKIDYISHVGDMLARTKDDVGGTKDIFAHAEIYVFCSAAISRRAMEKDPKNIAHCPYNLFVIQMPGEGGKVYVGHRDLPDGSMSEAEELLQKIAKEVTGM
jgi:uncharacterized protein (DUF302 family)